MPRPSRAGLCTTASASRQWWGRLPSRCGSCRHSRVLAPPPDRIQYGSASGGCRRTRPAAEEHAAVPARWRSARFAYRLATSKRQRGPRPADWRHAVSRPGSLWRARTASARGRELRSGPIRNRPRWVEDLARGCPPRRAASTACFAVVARRGAPRRASAMIPGASRRTRHRGHARGRITCRRSPSDRCPVSGTRTTCGTRSSHFDEPRRPQVVIGSRRACRRRSLGSGRRGRSCIGISSGIDLQSVPPESAAVALHEIARDRRRIARRARRRRAPRPAVAHEL